jgi:hypothetical protein
MKPINKDCNVEIVSTPDSTINTINAIDITEEELMELPKEVLQKMIETAKTNTQKRKLNKIVQGRVAKRLRENIMKESEYRSMVTSSC